MIKSICRTNIDKFRHERWPTRFVALSRRGDRVRAESGITLSVVDVTHFEYDDEPKISVELHERRSIG